MTSLDGINGRSIQTLLRGENDSKQSDEFQAIRDGPLQNLWGGGAGAGEVQKIYMRKGKLNEKKIMHAN